MKNHFTNSKFSLEIMRKAQSGVLVLTFMLLTFSAFSQGWMILTDGSILPQDVVPPVLTVHGNAPESITSIISDGSKSYLLMEDSTSAQRGQWRYTQEILTPNEYAATMLFMFKGSDFALNDAAFTGFDNRFLDLRIETGAYRENLFIYNDVIALEYTNVSVDSFDPSVWHILRIAMNNADKSFKVFIDEVPIPVIDVVMSSNSTNNRIYFGDNSTSRRIGLVADFMLFDSSGAYAPGEGAAIPTSLLPGDFASLGGISIDDEALLAFHPNLLEYEIELPSGTTTVPEVAYTLPLSGMSVEKTNAVELPGTTIVKVKSVDGTTEKIYKINFNIGIPSANAELLNILIDGLELDAFSPSILDYNVLLPFGTQNIPTVDFTVSDDNSNTVLTVASELPGTTTIEVIAEDGVTKNIYRIFFAVEDLDPSSADLNGLFVNNIPVEGFSPDVFSYDVILDYSSTIEVPIVTFNKVNQNAIDSLAVASAIPGSTKIWIISQDKSITKTYIVNFSVALAGTNADLTEIKINDKSIIDFNSNILEYTEILPFGTLIVPEISVVLADSNAFVTIRNAASISEATFIDVIAHDGITSKSYKINFTIPLSPWVVLTDGSVLPHEASPQMLFAKDNRNPELETYIITEGKNQYLLIADSLGTKRGEWEHDLIVNDPDNFKLTAVFMVKATEYALNDEVQGSNGRYVDFRVENGKWRDNIRIDNQGINLERLMGSNYMPYDASIWHVIRLVMDNADTTISIYIDENPIPYIQGKMNSASTSKKVYFGDSGDSRRVGMLTDFMIIDTTGAYAPGEGYALPESLLPQNYASISSISMNGNTIEGFHPEIENYDFVLPAGSVIPEIGYLLPLPGMSATISNATAIPGISSILVKSIDESVQRIYNLNFSTFSSDATLSQLKYVFESDTVSIADFSPEKNSYTVELSSNILDNITVIAVAENQNATIEIVQADSENGFASIVVTAHDGITTKTYTVNFSISSRIAESFYQNVKVFPVPTSTGFITIAVPGEMSNMSYTIHNLSGGVLMRGELEDSQTLINISDFLRGMYIVRIEGFNGMLVSKQIFKN